MKSVKTKFFISFIEEAVLNEDYDGYITGRVEVSTKDNTFPIEEIGFLTKDVDGFYNLRDLWDWRDINKNKLEELRKIIIDNYQEYK